MHRQVSDDRWDAVIVGASFGGLAAALALAGSGRVLLIDRAPIGADQTSACAAPLPVLEHLGVLDAVEQVHPHCVMHLPGGGTGHRFPTRHRWATFDYRRCCELLFERSGAVFRQARVRGLLGPSRVVSSAGEHEARVLVDASGWRAVLAGPAAARRSLAIELRLPAGGEGLHFWLRPEAVRHGYAWDFPAGDHRRVGVISYRESGGLRAHLDRFLGFPAPADQLHGGALPARLRDPAADGVFLVGDAAGQCLPLTGEGIRPALVFGYAAGRLARRVLVDGLPLAAALLDYRRLVLGARVSYAALAALQGMVGHLPPASVGPLCWLFDRSPLRRLAERQYWAAAPLELLEGAAAAGVRASAP